MARRNPLYEPECEAYHPYHSDHRCGCGPADAIHGPASECEQHEGEPCPNPDAHHDFTPVVSSAHGTSTSSADDIR